MWWLERDSNPRLFAQKATNLQMSHHPPYYPGSSCNCLPTGSDVMFLSYFKADQVAFGQFCKPRHMCLCAFNNFLTSGLTHPIGSTCANWCSKTGMGPKRPLPYHVMKKKKKISSLSYPRAAVLNLSRLADHFKNFVSVRGPPLKIVPLVH